MMLKSCSTTFAPLSRSPTAAIMKSASLGMLLGSLSGLLNLAAAGDFEWAGIFETPADDYLWTAQKVDGAYVDPGMKLVALPATSFTDQALHDLEAAGGQAMDLNCTAVQAGGTIVPAANVCYQLEFQATAWQSLFNVDASGVAGIAFFAEHVPTEFEATAHYLKEGARRSVALHPSIIVHHRPSSSVIVHHRPSVVLGRYRSHPCRTAPAKTSSPTRSCQTRTGTTRRRKRTWTPAGPSWQRC